MIPKIIMHNTISLNGSVTGLEVDMGLHYQIAGGYGADAHLIGSTTAKTGIEMFGDESPEEESSDFSKTETTANGPDALWVVVDSQGILKGQLHVFRKSGFCRDVMVLISQNTPDDYVNYLKEGNYDFIVTGKQHVELEPALEILNEEYGVNTVLVDSGPTLNGVLLRKGLVDEISLLISPVLLGSEYPLLFSRPGIQDDIDLEFSKCDYAGNGYAHLVYMIKKQS